MYVYVCILSNNGAPDNSHIYNIIYIFAFLLCSTQEVSAPKRSWDIKFIIVCFLDPIRYLSDVTVLARLHM